MSIHFSLRFLVLIFLTVGNSSWLLSQDAPDAPASVRVLQVQTAPSEQLRVLTSVVDNRDRPVKGLTPANFSARVGNQEITNISVRPVAEAAQPLSVLLALDVSGSMKGEAIEAAKAAAAAFLDELAKEDYCALTVFGTGVRHEVDFTREKRRLRVALEALQARDSKTWLNQAVYETLDRAGRAPTSRAVIIVLTDGKDEGSGLNVEDVISRATATGLPVYALGFGPEADLEFLRRLAVLTRGGYYATPDPQQLSSIYGHIADQLKNQYELILAVPGWRSGRYELTVSVQQRGRTLSGTQNFAYVPTAETEKPTQWVRWIADRLWSVGVAALVLGGLVVASILLFRKRRAPEDMPTPFLNVWLEVAKAPPDSGLSGLKFPLIDKKLVIGRSRRKAGLVLKNDFLVSRSHASIHRTPEASFVLEDCGSTTGTTINGERLAEPRRLESGDHVEIGQYELLFVDARRHGSRPQQETAQWWATTSQGRTPRPAEASDSTVGEMRPNGLPSSSIAAESASPKTSGWFSLSTSEHSEPPSPAHPGTAAQRHGDPRPGPTRRVRPYLLIIVAVALVVCLLVLAATRSRHDQLSQVGTASPVLPGAATTGDPRPATSGGRQHEAAGTQVTGQWCDANRQMKLEFLPDGAAQGRLNLEFDVPFPVSMRGAKRTVPATFIGEVEFRGRYRLGESLRPELYLPVACGGKTLSVLLAAGKLSAGELTLDFRVFRMQPAKFVKQAAGSYEAADLKPYGTADLEKFGFHVPNLSMPGIMVGENLFVTMGGRSGGALQITQGFTIQELPKALEVPVTFEHETTGGRMILVSDKPPAVKALVFTKGGLRLLTDYESKRVAYGLLHQAKEGSPPHVLRTVFQDRAEGQPSGSLSFTPHYVSFASSSSE